MNFTEAIAYLDSFTDYEKRSQYDYVKDLGIDRIRKLLSFLGNPQDSYESVLVAGTNGKGTTAAILSSLLSSAGNKTGLYTSPHLVSICERIRIGNELVSEADFARLVAEIKLVIDEEWIPSEWGLLTYFEILTACAFLYFSQQKIDVAVLEIGLGGRLDATNVVSPKVSIITPIAMDHQHILGDNILKIAAEKAGIIKSNGYLLSGRQQPEVQAKLKSIAGDLNSESEFLGLDFDYRKSIQTETGMTFEFMDEEYAIPFYADYQVDNALLALKAARVICPEISNSQIVKGFDQARWEGRFEKFLCNDVDVILDGAHNQHAAESLVKTLRARFRSKRIICLFSAVSDKAYEKVLNYVSEVVHDIYLCELNCPRRATIEDMKKIASPIFKNIDTIKEVRDAFEFALEQARKEKEILLVTGSLFLIGEVKRWVKGKTVNG